MRRCAATMVGSLALASVWLGGCSSSSPTQPAATAATCTKTFQAIGSIPSSDTSSLKNEQKLQEILDECPSIAAVNAALAPYIPAGKDKSTATQQADQTFMDVCQQISGVANKAPLCAAIG